MTEKKSKVTKAIEEQLKAVARVKKMTKKKSPQAPAGKWRYGVVKRKYKTILNNTAGGVTRFSETGYELAEVFDRGRSWTSEAITIGASSLKELKAAMQKAIADIDKYDVIVEKKPIVRDMRKKK